MMAKLLHFVFHPLVLGLVGLSALSAVVCIAGPMVRIGNAVPLETTQSQLLLVGVVAIACLLNPLWKRLRARRANATVVDHLMTPAADGAPDAASAELALIRERFDKALATLKQMRFGGRRGLWAHASARFGKRYLYELPWYVIIGAPGSGKTTALLNSGLEFPLAQILGETAVRGTGGTRDCDWWFTTDAVLIDTAGRYTTQDSHHEIDGKAWSAFLELVRRSRSRQPLNGVLVTVSITELLTRPAAERQQHGAALRARVQELHERLGIRFPIYLLVTKCDLLAGFMEYLGDAGKEMRHDPWGFTFALDADQRTDISALPGEFDRLAQRLTDGLVDRLQRERDPVRRARIYAFPQQFAAMREVIDEFVNKVFSPSPFEERPLLRGVYFISGTQEGTPIDRVLGAISRTYHLARVAPPANQATGKAFFLQRLLSDLVFAESALAGTNLKWERRWSWLVLSGYAAIALIVVSVATAWSVSWFDNRKYIAEVASRVDSVRSLIQATPNQASADMRLLLPALGATRALAIQDNRSVPWSLGFGLYQGRKLDSATQQVYRRMLVDAFKPRLSMRVEEQLRASAADPDLQYEVLKAYRMLHDREHFQREALKNFIMADWAVNLPREIGTDDRAALETHLDALLAQGASGSSLPQDVELVKDVRRRLAQAPLAQRIYARIRRDGVGTGIADFTLAKAGGPNATLVFALGGREAYRLRGVPGLYTYDGYHRGFQKSVDATARELRDEQGWVLGTDAGAAPDDASDLKRLADEVRRAYLEDYARQWEDFIAALRLLPTTGLGQSTQTARILSAPDNPLVPLMRAIVRETTLTESDVKKDAIAKAQDTAQQKIEASRAKLARMLGSTGDAPIDDGQRIESLVDNRFESLRQFVRGPAGGGPAPLDASVALINDIYLMLSAADTAVRGGNTPPPSDVPNKVKAEGGRWPEPVRSLVGALAATGNAATTGAARQNLSHSVRASIGDFCREAVTGRYPFARNSANDVTQADFGRLFAPGGLFDDFFQKNLAALVDTSTRPWRFRQLGEGAIARDSAALAQFQRAAAIRDTFFSGGSRTPALQLTFMPQEMDATITQFTLDLDGQLVRYAHGPQIPVSVQWPGPKGSAQVRVQLQPTLPSGTSGLTTDGPWALFRLFDRLQMTPGPSSERFKVTFNVDNRKATFEVRTSSVANPFRLRDLAEFACPVSL